MLLERKASIALYEKLKGIFEDAGTWTTPFTVYGKQDWQPGFTGTHPYIFIVAADPSPEFRLTSLPVVVIETMLEGIESGEMGGGVVGLLSFSYHVFADTDARLKDIVGAIMAYHGNVDILDQNVEEKPLQYIGQLVNNRGGRLWTQTNIKLSPYLQAATDFDHQLSHGRILSSAMYIPSLR